MEEAKDTNLAAGVNQDATKKLNGSQNRRAESQNDKDHSTENSIFSALPDLQILSDEWNTSCVPACFDQQHIIGMDVRLHDDVDDDDDDDDDDYYNELLILCLLSLT